MGRSWLSVGLGHGIRIGRSIGDSEWQPKAPHMPSYIKFEVTERLQKAAEARGETLHKDKAHYLIDRGLATGELNADGSPNFNIKGENAADLARAIIEGGAKWGVAVSPANAQRMAEEIVGRINERRALAAVAKWVAIGVAVIMLFAFVIGNAHADTLGDPTRQPDSAPQSTEPDDPDSPFTPDGHCKPGRVSCFEIAPEDGDEASQPRNDAAGLAAMRAVHDALDKLDSRTPKQ